MGKGPREDHGDGYGYDPKRSTARRSMENLEVDTERQDKPVQQLGKVLELPKVTSAQRRLMNANAVIKRSPAEQIDYQHTVLCQTGLPYRPTKERIWEREQGNVSLSIEAGRVRHPTTGKWIDVPLPHGEKPRLILMHLNGEALRQKSPEIEVERSMTAFARSIGLDTNGKSLRDFKEQMIRLSAAMIRLAVTEESHSIQVNTQIVGAFDLWFPKDEHQRVLWSSMVRLSQDYFDSLSRHAVPLDRRAIAALKHSAMALDVYSWLAQRLWRIEGGPQAISWAALKIQFGPGYARLRAFRAEFIAVLKEVKAVYPTAQFDVTDTGMTLWSSPPPIAPPSIAPRSHWIRALEPPTE